MKAEEAIKLSQENSHKLNGPIENLLQHCLNKIKGSANWGINETEVIVNSLVFAGHPNITNLEIKRVCREVLNKLNELSYGAAFDPKEMKLTIIWH